MKAIKMIKSLSFSLIAGGLLSTGVYAQDMDVTMDVVKKSDAKQITETITNRIDLPESAKNAGNHVRRDRDQDNHQGQHRDNTHGTMDDNHQMRDDRHQVRDDVNDMRDGSHQVRDDVNDMRGDRHQVRSDVNDMRGDRHQVRGDVNDMRDGRQ